MTRPPRATSKQRTVSQPTQLGMPPSTNNYLVVTPLSVAVSKTKSFSLNLNQYRNTHYQILNKAKHSFKECLASQIEALPNFEKVALHYIIFPKTKRRFDLANIGSVVDKFFSDALVELGKLPDDNYQYVQSVSFSFGEVSINPRVEVHIHELL